MTRKRTNLFTVIGYSDGDHNVETFVERVKAHDSADAWEQCLKKLHRDEAMCAHEIDNATEIATYPGWLQS